MPLQLVPLDQGMLGNADGSVLVALVASELLVNPRMSISGESQSTLWLPLFYGSDKTLDAVLASIGEVFLVLDNLAHLTDEGIVVADHSIKAIIGMDAMRPAVVQEYHLIVRQQTLRGLP